MLSIILVFLAASISMVSLYNSREGGPPEVFKRYKITNVLAAITLLVSVLTAVKECQSNRNNDQLNENASLIKDTLSYTYRKVSAANDTLSILRVMSKQVTDSTLLLLREQSNLRQTLSEINNAMRLSLIDTRQSLRMFEALNQNMMKSYEVDKAQYDARSPNIIIESDQVNYRDTANKVVLTFSMLNNGNRLARNLHYDGYIMWTDSAGNPLHWDLINIEDIYELQLTPWGTSGRALFGEHPIEFPKLMDPPHRTYMVISVSYEDIDSKRVFYNKYGFIHFTPYDEQFVPMATTHYEYVNAFVVSKDLPYRWLMVASTSTVKREK